uniref:Secreted protein n=1 Tax=Achlya hypogyna TaxID=1202772 RepID=A0A0A7CNK1_ACHHY|nr:secreted protein [Achlya hypogyna]
MQMTRLFFAVAAVLTVAAFAADPADIKPEVATGEPKICYGCDRFWKPCCGFPKPPEDKGAEVAGSGPEPKLCYGCDRFWKPCCGFPQPPEDKADGDKPVLRGAASQDESARMCNSDCWFDWKPCCIIYKN